MNTGAFFTGAIDREARTGSTRRREIEAIRSRLVTTPGRLSLLTVLLVLAVAAACALSVYFLQVSLTATRSISFDSGPGLREAGELYVALSDADASAAQGFLTSGIEPAAERTRYLGDLRTAATKLTVLTTSAANSPIGQRDVEIINEQLPIYAGLVATAQTNSRQGFPVGAAYLSQASTKMRSEILPAVQAIYQDQAERLDQRFRSVTPSSVVVVLAVIAALVMALLVASQAYLSHRFHRLFNLPLITATVVVLALIGALTAILVSERRHLDAARGQGIDQIALLSSGRILALRLQTDESLRLAARGGDTTHLDDFNATWNRLGGVSSSPSLLDQITNAVASHSATHHVDDLRRDMGRYSSEHQTVNRLATANDYQGATDEAVKREAAAFQSLNQDFQNEIDVSRARFEVETTSARRILPPTQLIVVISAVLVAALAVVGLGQRIREYR